MIVKLPVDIKVEIIKFLVNINKHSIGLIDETSVDQLIICHTENCYDWYCCDQMKFCSKDKSLKTIECIMFLAQPNMNRSKRRSICSKRHLISMIVQKTRVDNKENIEEVKLKGYLSVDYGFNYYKVSETYVKAKFLKGYSTL